MMIKKHIIFLLLSVFLLVAPDTAYAVEQVVPVVDTPQQAVREVSAADGKAYFSIDVRKDPKELATDEISNDVAGIIDGKGSDSTKAREVATTLEDSGYYYAEKNGARVNVTSLFANMRIMVEVPYAESMNTHGASSAVYFRDHYLLSYETEEATKEAYDLFLKEYGEEKVLLDMPVKLNEAAGWGTAYMGLDKKAETASGSSVIVAVLDSGINRSHKIFSNKTILQGYDFISGDNDPEDKIGHGTSVAGIIAESTPSNVSILPIKITDGVEGSILDVLYGIEYAEENGASVINMSLSADYNADVYKRLTTRLSAAHTTDAVLVAASGNESRDLDGEGVNMFPTEVDGVLGVGAFDKDGKICSFSNYGSAVDFAAPGKGLSLAGAEGEYYTASGTSFSTPYISAAAAVIKSENPSFNAEQISDRLAEQSEDLGDEGRDPYFGSGCPVLRTDEADPQPADISDAAVYGIEDRSYTGENITQNIRLELDGKTLTENTDYSVSYENNIDAGTAKVLIEGMGNFNGTLEKSFSISSKQITPEITLDEYSFVSDGTEKTPIVTVKDGDTVIDKSFYDVTYDEGRIEAGTYKVYITLKGNYAGSGEASFSIEQNASSDEQTQDEPKDEPDPQEETPADQEKPAQDTPVTAISACEIIGPADAAYTGSAIEQEIRLTHDGKQLELNKEYTVRYENNTNAGVAKAIIEGKGAYSGTLEREFRILPKKISPELILSETNFTYNGSKQAPSLEVKADGKVLDKDSYDASFPEKSTDAGTYTVKVVLSGNYEGSESVDYTIAPKQTTPSLVLSSSSLEYTGSERTPDISVYDGNSKLSSSDYTVKYDSGRINVGEYKAYVTLEGNYSGNAEAVFTITPKSITPKVVLSLTTVDYTGSRITPDVTVKDGDKILEEGDYDVTYDSGRINAGTYKVSVVLKGNYEGTGESSFKIARRHLSPEIVLSPSSYTYDGQKKNPSVSVYYAGNKINDIDVEYPEGRTNAGTYTVTARLNGNYTGKDKATFAIYSADSPLTAKGRTVNVKYKKLRKKTQTIQLSKAVRIRDSVGTLSFSKLQGNPKIRINKKTGKITVQKKLKRGTYKVRILVQEEGNPNYKMTSRIAVVKIKIR